MGGNHILYFNFFTIGALIPVVFHFLITVFFLSIPEKSRATFHLGVAFFLITLFLFQIFAYYFDRNLVFIWKFNDCFVILLILKRE